MGVITSTIFYPDRNELRLRRRRNREYDVEFYYNDHNFPLTIDESKLSQRLGMLTSHLDGLRQPVRVLVTCAHEENLDMELLEQAWMFMRKAKIYIAPRNVFGFLKIADNIMIMVLLGKCETFIAALLNVKNVLWYLNKAVLAGHDSLVKHIESHLNIAFWEYVENREFLERVPINWLCKMTDSTAFLLKGNEMRVYNTVKRWIMLNEMKSTNKKASLSLKFCDFIAIVNPKFDLKMYRTLLATIRLPHLLASYYNLRVVKQDKLIPAYIIKWVISDIYKSISGPYQHKVVPRYLQLEEFDANCLRTGRLVFGNCEWQWYRSIFGIHLMFQYNKGVLSVKRTLPNLEFVDLCEEICLMIETQVVDVEDSNVKFCSHDSLPKEFTLKLTESHVLGEVPYASMDNHLMVYMNIFIKNRRYYNQQKYWKKFSGKTKKDIYVDSDEEDDDESVDENQANLHGDDLDAGVRFFVHPPFSLPDDNRHASRRPLSTIKSDLVPMSTGISNTMSLMELTDTIP